MSTDRLLHLRDELVRLNDLLVREVALLVLQPFVIELVLIDHPHFEVPRNAALGAYRFLSSGKT